MPLHFRSLSDGDRGPADLLRSVDRRAKVLGVSRNRLIVRALEQTVRERSGWAPEFLEKLRRVDEETATAVDELLADVKRGRRSNSHTSCDLRPGHQRRLRSPLSRGRFPSRFLVNGEVV